MAREREREKERKKKSDESPRRKRIRHWWCRTGNPSVANQGRRRSVEGARLREREEVEAEVEVEKLFPVGKRGGSPHVTGSGLEGERKRFQRQEI